VQLVPNRRRLLAPGIGDTLARGFEFAATIAIFFGLGYLLDRAFDTTPLFMVLLFVFALVGQTVRAWLHYGDEIDKEGKARRALAQPLKKVVEESETEPDQ
jgi:Putative F0F1-ATPase subunit Ca2+/Mg2+ transporter